MGYLGEDDGARHYPKNDDMNQTNGNKMMEKQNIKEIGVIKF